MRTTILMCFLLTFVENVFSQLLMMDKSKIDFIKIKYEPESINIVTKNKRKQSIPSDNVIGQVYTESYFHKLPIQSFEKNRNYDFVRRKYEGTINIYERITTGNIYVGQNGQVSGSATYIDLFLEKGGMIRNFSFTKNSIIPITSAKKKKERIDTLRELIGDMPEISAMLDDQEFTPNYNNIIELVRKYNVSRFNPAQTDDNNRSMTMFYTRMNAFYKKPSIKLVINDSMQYDIPAIGTLVINLETYYPNKVCAVVNDMRFCDIIFGSPYYVKYFEIDVKNNNKSIDIMEVFASDAKKYLLEEREYNKK